MGFEGRGTLGEVLDLRERDIGGDTGSEGRGTLGEIWDLRGERHWRRYGI